MTDPSLSLSSYSSAPAFNVLKMEFRSLDELFEKYPWRTYLKFKPLANRYGFTDETAIKEFLKTKAGHDTYKPQGNRFLPIYSKSTGAYQFDTLIQSHGKPWLIFINVNTRRAYGYKMENKGAGSVLLALQKFISDCPDVKVMTSDQDAAYLSDAVINFMRQHNIDYRTTETNNHNVLGIINRFMRTLRDLNGTRDFDDVNMNDLIREYNASPHRGINYKTPNEMTAKDEHSYAQKKEQQFKENMNDLQEGARVRIVLEKKRIGKNRTNLSKEAYEVTGRKGNQFIIQAKDGTIDTYPLYRLVKCDNRYKLAETIRTGVKQNIIAAVVEDIIGYNKKKNQYKVKWEGSLKPSYTDAKSMRIGRPTHLSTMERQYWARQKQLPQKIKRYL